MCSFCGMAVFPTKIEPLVLEMRHSQSVQGNGPPYNLLGLKFSSGDMLLSLNAITVSQVSDEGLYMEMSLWL